MLSESLDQRERDQFGFEVNDLPRRCRRHGGRRVAKTFHRADVGEERFVAGPLETPAHPEHGLAVAGNQQHAVLHRAGEIVLVDPAKERGQFPIRVLRIHPRPEALHPVRQL